MKHIQVQDGDVKDLNDKFERLLRVLRKEEEMDQASLVEQLTALQTSVNSLLEAAQAAPASSTTPDPNDELVENIVADLVTAGYTVTPPAAASDQSSADASSDQSSSEEAAPDAGSTENETAS